MLKKERISELEFKMDYMNTRLLNTLSERQDKAIEQIRKYNKDYFSLTGKMYIPLIQRKKYEEGDY